MRRAPRLPLILPLLAAFAASGPAEAPAPELPSPPATVHRLSDAEAVSLARGFAEEGNCRLALDVLGVYFARPDRDTGLDLEASVLREACAPPAPAPHAAPSPPRPRPRLWAVQVFVFASSNLGGLREELRALREGGADTIIVRAFHNQGDRPLLPGLAVAGPGVYFRTTAAPVAADLLGEVVDAARAEGLRVFGWMTGRTCDWLASERPGWLESSYDPARGRSFPARSLSIFQPGVRDHLLALYRDLGRTGVDGILVQDDLVLRFGEGFSPAAVQAYLSDTGRVLHPDDLFLPPSSPGGSVRFAPPFWDWARWKSARLTAWLDDLAAAGREANPSLLLAANVYYETLLTPERGLAWYAQDAAALAARADYLALMTYHRQMGAELGLSGADLEMLLSQAVEAARRLTPDEGRSIFKVQTFDWGTGQPVAAAEWEAVLSRFREAGGFSTARLQN